MTADQLLVAIERRMTVRKIWRCAAGWGMFFIKVRDHPPDREVVYRYYPTIRECIRTEYRQWVLNEHQVGYPDPTEPDF